MLDINLSEVEFAPQAVHLASLLVCQVQAELASASMTKDDHSPVTVADFAAQALVGGLLAERFPDDILVAEEEARPLCGSEGQEMLQQVTGYVKRFAPQATPEAVCAWIERGTGQPGRRFWTLDPLDGTKGFLRGGQFAVALALLMDGLVEVGVLGCPNLRDSSLPGSGRSGSLVVAVRGQGCWATSLAEPGRYQPLNVSKRSDPAQMRLLRSFEAGHTNQEAIDRLAQLFGAQIPSLRMDSQAKYALLAAGASDLMVRLLSPQNPDYREKIWDQAAGSLVLEEAGGRVTDLHGKPLDFTSGRTLTHNRGVLASNGLFHPLALDLLASLGV